MKLVTFRTQLELFQYPSIYSKSTLPTVLLKLSAVPSTLFPLSVSELTSSISFILIRTLTPESPDRGSTRFFPFTLATVGFNGGKLLLLFAATLAECSICPDLDCATGGGGGGWVGRATLFLTVPRVLLFSIKASLFRSEA